MILYIVISFIVLVTLVMLILMYVQSTPKQMPQLGVPASPSIVGGEYDENMRQVGEKFSAIEASYPEMKNFTAAPGQTIQREKNGETYYFAFLTSRLEGKGFEKAVCFSVDVDNTVRKIGDGGSDIVNAETVDPKTCKAVSTVH